jgi:hypothetical protein
MGAGPPRRDTASMPSTSPSHTFSYVETDVAAGMTLSEWRAEKVRSEAGGRRSGFLRRRGR